MRARVLAPVLFTVVALTACGSETATEEPVAADPSSAGSLAPETPEASEPACAYPPGQPAAKQVSPPPATAQATGDVEVTMKTSVGDIGATLDGAAAPCTVNSFLSLAEQGYFDDTVCHRLTTADSGIFVLQCGDPTATGTGGPGYTIPDELAGDETYRAGTLAMANTGVPGSGGSQFFIVYDDTPLPPQYTVFGTVGAKGLKVVRNVAAAGHDQARGSGDGQPLVEVRIQSVSVP